MTPARDQQLSDLFHAARELPREQRAGFLAEACASDAELRREVEALLEGYEAAGDFLNEPVQVVARSLWAGSSNSSLLLPAGSQLGRFAVVSHLGAGGMGEVYLAEDTRLARRVAIKLLPAAFTADAGRVRRFVREAKAASALNHPNIITVHEIGEADGRHFIVTEYVEGETLRERMRREKLGLVAAIDVAIQVASALAAAHEAGIVHRDIKPENLMLRRDGYVKVLDFGLAKITERYPFQAASDSDSNLPAATTEAGMVMGTARYVSPEQARGENVDARTDIFSLGIVLFEMITGRLPFNGVNAIEVMSAILNHEPAPFPEYLAGAPPVLAHELERIVAKTLRKDREERYQAARDLLPDLRSLKQALELFAVAGPEARAGDPVSGAPQTATGDSKSAIEAGKPSSEGPPASPWSLLKRGLLGLSGVAASPGRRLSVRKAALLTVGMAAVVTTTLIVGRLLRQSPDVKVQPTVKFTITPNKLARGGDTDIDAEVSISGDGRHIVYVESEGGQLRIRDIDQEKARLVPGATRIYQAFWSPDGQSIGYAVGPFGPDLVKIPVQGGTPTLIARFQGQFRRASWSSDGETIVYCDNTGLYTVPAKGGEPTRIIEHAHIEHPSFLDLPDGRYAVLFQAVEPGLTKHGIYVQTLGQDRRRLLTLSSSSNPYPAYSPTGHILYVDGTGDSVAIWALPFSLTTLQPSGKAFPIAQNGSSHQVSRTGTLVYTDVPSDRLQLVWTDRSGRSLSTIGEPQRQNRPMLSPDGRRLAMEVREGDSDIWVYDLDRPIKTRFTFDSAAESLGAWTPSGDQIIYASNRNGSFDIFSQSSSGNGEATLLVGTPRDERASDWSSGQRFLIYQAVSPQTKGDLLYRERHKDGSLGAPVVLLQTPFNEGAARFSPDGGFIAYFSDESGQNEIYVRDFPEGANKWRISTHGGLVPRWRRDGKEIFFIEGSRLMAVSVTTRPAFSAGLPAPLFERRSLETVNFPYDVSSDGKRFVLLDRLVSEQPLTIHVVHNWFEEFRSREPKK